MWVCPKCNHKYSYEREADGDIFTQKKRREWDQRGRDWSDAARSQGMPVVTRNWMRQGTDNIFLCYCLCGFSL